MGSNFDSSSRRGARRVTDEPAVSRGPAENDYRQEAGHQAGAVAPVSASSPLQAAADPSPYSVATPSSKRIKKHSPESERTAAAHTVPLGRIDTSYGIVLATVSAT